MYRRRLERFPKILTPSEFAKKILEEREGKAIYDPKGLRVIVRPDRTKEVIRLSEVERRQNDFLSVYSGNSLPWSFSNGSFKFLELRSKEVLA